MEFQEVLRKRAMIRRFRSTPVDGDRITRVLKSAWRAPSAGHLQPQDFIVVRDPITKRKLVEAALDQSFIEEAPVVVVVCSDTRRNIERYGERAVKFYSVIDGAFASLIILLSVVDEGLGACFVGAFEDAVVSRVLGLPREVRPIGIIPIGYPAEKPKRLARIPLERRVHVDGYGSSKFTGALGKTADERRLNASEHFARSDSIAESLGVRFHYDKRT